MTREDVEHWIAAYEAAWRAPGTEALAGVFAPDAAYSFDPCEPTITGLDAIAEMWDDERSEGEEFEMSHEIVAVDGDTAVVRVHVQYRKPREQEEWPFFPHRPRVA